MWWHNKKESQYTRLLNGDPGIKVDVIASTKKLCRGCKFMFEEPNPFHWMLLEQSRYKCKKKFTLWTPYKGEYKEIKLSDPACECWEMRRIESAA